jgi:hypothetical protein
MSIEEKLARIGSEDVFAIRFRDGEEIRGRRLSVVPSGGIISYELLSSNRNKSHYAEQAGGFVANISDILDVVIMDSQAH